MSNVVYLKLFVDCLEKYQKLNDTEFGRLVRAALRYKATGAEPDELGREALLWDGMRLDIDRDNESYASKCSERAVAGKKGADARWKGHNKDSKNSKCHFDDGKNGKCHLPYGKNGQDKDKDKDKDKDTNITPLTPLAPFPGASPELCDAFAAWLSYKKERRETYKATGLQALMSRIQAAAGQYGDRAVAELIRDCMAASWKGIIFDRLKNAPPPSRQQRASWADIAAQMDAEEVYQ